MCCVDEDVDPSEAQEIPLLNVHSATLSKVLAWCTYHVTNPMATIEKPIRSSNIASLVSAWDAEFVNVDQGLLFELILAANYMNVKGLLDLTCTKVASMIKGGCTACLA